MSAYAAICMSYCWLVDETHGGSLSVSACPDSSIWQGCGCAGLQLTPLMEVQVQLCRRHINNITERNYVKIAAGRRVVPTELGITLVRGYQLIDPDLASPQACLPC